MYAFPLNEFGLPDQTSAEFTDLVASVRVAVACFVEGFLAAPENVVALQSWLDNLAAAVAGDIKPEDGGYESPEAWLLATRKPSGYPGSISPAWRL